MSPETWRAKLYVDLLVAIATRHFPGGLTHNQIFPVPPRIHYLSHAGPLEVLQGATVKMECRASGNPVPSVAWTRKNNVLPSGERSVSGLSLVIQHADRHSAGQYQCSADNGVGQPDTRHITLNVLCKYLYLVCLLMKIPSI